MGSSAAIGSRSSDLAIPEHDTMKKSFAKIAAALVIAPCFSAPALADLNNCSNLYVGRIWIERGSGLMAVVFLNSPTDASGSYWSYFNNWSVDEKKSALATLVAAKLAGHRVNVVTDNSDQCGIVNSAYNIKSVFIATNP
jgi:hypothetical protein